MAIEFFCPACGSKTTTRSSSLVTPTLTKAKVICRSCNVITDVDLQATKVLVPHYTLTNEVFKWTVRPAANDPRTLSLFQTAET